jgi:hypothetical protein
MIRTTKWALAGLLGLAVTVAMTGCGESGSLIADGGIRGTGKSVGPVSGFGSVIVNGVRYNTDDTQFIVNDDPSASQGSLSEGMVVIVDVDDDDEEQANRITYSDDLRGPLTGDFNPLSNRMTVLGQTIRFNGSTVFRGLSPAQLDTLLETGVAYVSISGWYLDSGEFLASFVRAREGFEPSIDEVKISGVIADFNLPRETFMIGSQTVDYSQNPEISMDDDRDELLASDKGSFVEVEGHLDAIGGTLFAEEIEEEDIDDRLGDIDGSGIRIEGSINRSLDDTPNGTFWINGIEVRVNRSTELDGLNTGDLREGMRIFIEGVGDTGATVVAKRIETREPDAEVEAPIQDIAASANPREGQLLVGGVRVQVTLRTIVVDDDEDDGRGNLQFGDLRTGDFIAVTGVPREDEQGVYIDAVKVERDDEDDDNLELKGRVESIGSDAFAILGATMNVDGGTDYDDGLAGFGDIDVGQRLEVDYRLDGNLNLLARKIERDEDDVDDIDDGVDDDSDIGEDDDRRGRGGRDNDDDDGDGDEED